MALDRPLAGRIFFEQLIRDNPDIGRPDKVSTVFGRTIRQRGEFRIPGTFRTQVITYDTCPYLYLFYKKTQVKQCLKEGRKEGRKGAPYRYHRQPAPRPRHRHRHRQRAD